MLQGTQLISRKAAQAAGLRRYFPGPCSKGHVSERNVKDAKCRECVRERKRRADLRRPANQDRQAAMAARKEAFESGSKTFMWYPCSFCGDNLRRFRGGWSGSTCVTCSREKSRRNGQKKRPVTLEAKLDKGSPDEALGNPTAVYVMVAGEFCKIGVAEDPAARLRSVQCGCPMRVSVVSSTVPLPKNVAYWLERVAHLHFADRRAQGEWFAVPAEEAIRFIEFTRLFS